MAGRVERDRSEVPMCVIRNDVYDLSKVHFCIAQAAFWKEGKLTLPSVLTQ